MNAAWHEARECWWRERHRDRARLGPLADAALAASAAGSVAHARALQLRAWDRLWRGDLAGARADADAAEPVLAAAADTAGLADGRDLAAMQCVYAGEYARALERVAADAGPPMDDRGPRERSVTHAVRHLALRGLHRYDEALREAYRQHEAAIETGDPAYEANALGTLGGLLGDLHALEDAERLLARGRARVDPSSLQAWWLCSVNLMCTLDYQGRAAEALPLAQELLARERELPRVRAHHRLLSYAAVWLHAGDAGQAEQLLDHSLALMQPGAPRRIEAYWLQAELFNRQARHAEARRVCEQFIASMAAGAIEGAPAGAEDPDRLALPYDRVRLHRAAALACEALGDSAAALAQERQAFALYRQLSGRSAQARRLALEIEHELDSARRGRERAEAERARLTALNTELERANQAKSRFLAAASHDLRQPVHALSLQMSALRGELVTARQREMADRIERCVGALSGLFDGLLDLSRLDAGVVQPQWQSVALPALLATLVEQHQPEAHRKGLNLSLRLPRWPALPCARSDPRLLERLLRNLLVNALKYTERGGVLVALRQRADGWRLEVRDSGHGIAAELQPRVFDEFFQVGNSARQRDEGLGLGLAIVVRLARVLGHEITLRSAPDRGSCFALHVDAAAAPDAAPAGPAPAQGPLGLCVAVIDDDRETRAALADLLAQWHCEPRTAEQAAPLTADAAWRPDAAIVDYRLPDGRDGLGEVAALRRRFGDALPCLIVTGETSPPLLRGLQASGLPWAAKPLAAAALRQWLAGLRR